MSGPFRFPWDSEPVPTARPPETPAALPKPRGRRPASVTRARVQTTGSAPDWLYHHLTVSGPADTLAAFAAAARGAGVIPWQLDFAAIEEDVFLCAVSEPARREKKLTIEGCRILARQFREKVEAHQAQAAALVGHSMACPFDLQALLPVPAAILALGPTHPTALSWMAGHWGVTDRLRQVLLRDKPAVGRRLRRGHSVIGYGFFTAGETPHAAIGQFAERWPGMRFFLRPRPAD